MKNKFKILKFFSENKDKEFSIKKVSETIKMNYKIVYETIDYLESKKLIKFRKKGASKLCTFNYKYTSEIAKVENIRKKELFKNEDIKLIFKRIKEIKYPFYCLIIFGSYANKTHKKNSDIDICLICDDKNISEKINDVLDTIPTDTHLQKFTTNEFLSMIELKKSNIGNEIIKNNIVLHGLENFYELVNYVK